MPEVVLARSRPRSRLLRRRLQVAVPRSLRAAARHSGHEHMWRRVLAGLDGRCRIVDAERAGRRSDVWLYDGHQLPPAGAGPARVAQVHEAGWTDPAIQATIEPAFLAALHDHTMRTASTATLLITPSASSRDQLVEHYGADPDRVRVVHHGVDHAVFGPTAGDVGRLLRAGGGDPARPYVLFVSQLHPRKNLAALRAAMATLVERGYPHQLAVVGGTPVDRSDAPDLVAAARAPVAGRPVVALEGLADPDLASLMAGADAFCLPSLMEGFGMTVLEAMACATPVVVSDRGALPEVVGDAGVVVEPDAGAVADALAALLDDPAHARALGERGRARAAAFTWERTVDGWHDALAEAAGW